MFKKVLTAVALTVTMTTTAHAGLWDSAVTSGWPTKDVTTKYKLDTYGFDVRVYEWTPRDNKNVRCVFVAGSNNSTGVACYNIPEKSDK